MGWLFGKDRAPEKTPVFRTEIPRDDDRRGPAPPPPRTAHAPGVRVYAFADLPSQNLLRLDNGSAGFFLEREEGGRRSAALLVLTGRGEAGNAALVASPGDVLIWTAVAQPASATPAGRPPSHPLEELSRTSPRPHQNMSREGPLLSLAEISRTSPPPRHHIRRDGLTGTAVTGITGLRALARVAEAGLAVLRLGPPPGARWVFKGVAAVAVFSGRLAAFDGEDVKAIRAGSLALVADPSATLYLEAGNDAALAVALAAENFVAALG